MSPQTRRSAAPTLYENLSSKGVTLFWTQQSSKRVMKVTFCLGY